MAIVWEMLGSGDCVGDGGQWRLCGRWWAVAAVWEMVGSGGCVEDVRQWRLFLMCYWVKANLFCVSYKTFILSVYNVF